MKNNFFSDIKMKFSVGRLMLTVLMLLVVVLGSTFAWITFRSSKSALVLTIGDVNKTQVKLTPYQLNANLIPSTEANYDIYSDVTVTNGRNDDTSITLFYRINNPTNYQGDLNYMIVSKDAEDVGEDYVPSSEDIVSTGKITPSEMDKDKIIMNSSVGAGVDNLYYRVYVWADALSGDTSSAQGSEVSLELNATIASVTISGDNQYKGTLTTNIADSIASSTNNTYSYQWYYKTSPDAEPVAIYGANDSTYTIQSGLVGTYISVEVTTDGNFSEDLVYSDITNTTVSAISPTLSLATTSLTYNGSERNAEVVTNSDGTTSLTYYTNNICTTSIEGAPVDAGQYYVYATFSGGNDENGNHYKVINADGDVVDGMDHGEDFTANSLSCSSFKVNPKPIQITVTATDKEYDGTTTAYCSTELGVGVFSGDDVYARAITCEYRDKNASNGQKDVSWANVLLQGEDSGNYTVSSDTTSGTTTAKINKKSVWPTLFTNDKTYDGTTNVSCLIGLNGLVGMDSVNASYTSCSMNNKNAGMRTANATGITLSGSGASNYSLTETTASSSVRVNPAPLDLGNYSVVHTGASSYTRMITGVNSEPVTVTYTPYITTAGIYSYSTTSGSGKYTASLSSSNYTVNSAGNLTIMGEAVLMSDTNSYESGGYDTFLRSSVLRENVCSITFVDNITSATGTITNADADNTGSIKMWHGEAGDYGCYDVYIGSATGVIKFPEDSSYLFSFLHQLASITFKNGSNVLIDTSEVTDMSYMFYELGLMVPLDLSLFDTSNVTNMSYMFAYGATEEINVSTWDTSSVVNMEGMFGYSGFTSLDLSSWDTSSVANMSNMFVNDSFTSITLGSDFKFTSDSSLYTPYGSYSINGMTRTGYWYRKSDWAMFTPTELTTASAFYSVAGTYVTTPFIINYYHKGSKVGSSYHAYSVCSGSACAYTALKTLSDFNQSIQLSSASSAEWTTSNSSTTPLSASLSAGNSYMQGKTSMNVYSLYKKTYTFTISTNPASSTTSQVFQYINVNNGCASDGIYNDCPYSTVTPPAATTISGHEFAGWLASDDNVYTIGTNGTFASIAAVPDSNLLQFSNVYTATTDANGNASSAVTFNTRTNLAANMSSTSGNIYYTPTTNRCTVKLPALSNMSDSSSFVPVGWNVNTTAGPVAVTYTTATNATVPCTNNLYAVYKRTATFYYGVSQASNSTVTQYYNANGNYSVKTPDITDTLGVSVGWTGAGWTTGTEATVTGIITKNSTSTTSSGPTFYAVYSRTLTFIHGKYGAEVRDTRTQYYNSYGTTGSVAFPALTKLTNWNASGYRRDSDKGSKKHNQNVTAAYDYTYTNELWGIYTRTIKVNYNADGGTLISGNTTLASVTAYYNAYNNMAYIAPFTLKGVIFTKPKYSYTKWCGTNSGTSTCKNISASTSWYPTYSENSSYTLELTPNWTYDGDAYAVYSDTDKSLRFYRSTTEITAGTTYNGLVSTKVYTGFEDSTGYPGWYNVMYDSYQTLANVVKTVVFEDYIYPISTANWFAEFRSATTIDVAKLDTSNVTNMSSMFYYATSVKSLDVSNWDTSKVTDMSYLIWCNTEITSLDLDGWDTSKVTNMAGMFNMMYAVTSLNITGWDTSQVTNMGYMFQMTSTISLDLRGWNVCRVTSYDGFNNNGNILQPSWGMSC